MQTLVLTAEELELVAELVQHALSQIDVEVFRTDTREFKDMLKHRRAVLEQLMAKLPPQEVKA